jgi:hypothetical protein
VLWILPLPRPVEAEGAAVVAGAPDLIEVAVCSPGGARLAIGPLSRIVLASSAESDRHVVSGAAADNGASCAAGRRSTPRATARWAPSPPAGCRSYPAPAARHAAGR